MKFLALFAAILLATTAHGAEYAPIGSKCNPSLLDGPRCAPNANCFVANPRPGAPGICEPKLAQDGDSCGGGPPNAIYCADGLWCAHLNGLVSGMGTCVRKPGASGGFGDPCGQEAGACDSRNMECHFKDPGLIGAQGVCVEKFAHDGETCGGRTVGALRCMRGWQCVVISHIAGASGKCHLKQLQ